MSCVSRLLPMGVLSRQALPKGDWDCFSFEKLLPSFFPSFENCPGDTWGKNIPEGGKNQGRSTPCWLREQLRPRWLDQGSLIRYRKAYLGSRNTHTIVSMVLIKSGRGYKRNYSEARCNSCGYYRVITITREHL